jgi:hypothetical protein
MAQVKKAFRTTIVRDGSMCFIPVPFDPTPIFGKVRAPVVVTLNGYSYRSTIASMGNGPCIPLRRSNREAAGLEGNETLQVTLELDVAKRAVEPPPDLVRALKAKPSVWQRWQALSYSHQREHVEAIEAAKKPETRLRRIQSAKVAVLAKPPPKEPAGRRRLNAEWHERHPMPKSPSTQQRLTWHVAHEKNCGCRPMPAKLRALLR